VATATSYVPNWKQSFGEEKVFHVYAGGVGQTYRLMLLVVESQGAARSVNWFVPVAKMCRSSIAVSDIAFFFPCTLWLEWHCSVHRMAACREGVELRGGRM